MIRAGVDIGSVATKAVLLGDEKVLGKAIVKTGVNPREAAEEALSRALNEAGIKREKVERIASTGYGRRSVDFGDKVITEISADARGAFFLGCPWGKPRLIADLGGQDTKVILLDQDGGVADFQMNDKCAAGTGRFLEVMAGVLGVELDQMGEVCEQATAPVQINSTCTVFAESEVVSLITGGAKKEDIIAGLHAAITSRLVTMLRQMKDEDVFFNGGGARNKGIKKALEKELGRRVYVPPGPQFVVSLGAALMAAD